MSIGDAAEESCQQSITIEAGWDIEGNTNGGYLMQKAAGVMADLAGRSQPLSVTAHFLRPVPGGAAQVTAQVLKRGRMLTTLRGDLAVGGKSAVTLLGAFGDGQESGQENSQQSDQEVAKPSHYMGGQPPTLPALADCVAAVHPLTRFELYERVRLRCAPDDPGILQGQVSGQGSLQAWISPPGDAPLASPADLLLLVDCFPPPVFDLHLPISWTPTIELTVHIRGTPAPGWLQGCASTRFVSGGLLEESVELWDCEGQLVAQARQLAVEPRPR